MLLQRCLGVQAPGQTRRGSTPRLKLARRPPGRLGIAARTSRRWTGRGDKRLAWMRWTKHVEFSNESNDCVNQTSWTNPSSSRRQLLLQCRSFQPPVILCPPLLLRLSFPILRSARRSAQWWSTTKKWGMTVVPKTDYNTEQTIRQEFIK